MAYAHINGTRTQVLSYGFAREDVSTDPSNTMNGVGTLSLDIPIMANWQLLRGKMVTFFPEEGPNGGASYLGQITGVVKSSGTRLTVSTLDAATSRINVNTSLPPMHSTVQEFCDAIADAVGLPGIVYDHDLEDRTLMVSPGVVGNIWVYFRQFLQYRKFSIYTDQTGKVFVRKQTTAVDDVIKRPINMQESMDFTQRAKYVEVSYTNAKWVTQGQIYPIARGEMPSVITVQSGETAVVEVSLNANVISVNQPAPADYVNSTHNPDGSNGLYVVSGSDGLPVSASRWQALGGSVRVHIKPGTLDTLIITVTAPTAASIKAPTGVDRFAPYSIALADNAGAGSYSTLFITGTGVTRNVKTLKFPTGVSGLLPADDVGTTLENVFVATLSDAYDIGSWLARNYTGVQQSITYTSADLTDIDLLGKRVTSGDSVFHINQMGFSTGGVALSGTDATSYQHVFDNDAGDHDYTYNDTMWVGYTYDDALTIPLRKEYI